MITGPVSALLDGARAVRAGDLSHRVSVQATDELASLVRAFNEMTSEVESNRGELEQRRRFIETVLENIPTGVISLSPDATIQLVNGAMRSIFPAALLESGQRLPDILPAEYQPDFTRLLKRARRIGVASRQIDLETALGPKHLSITVSALDARAAGGFVMVVEDTSELLRAQKAAAWHEVARRIAHELKNPLTPIALSSERIARQVDKCDAPAEVKRIVRDCCATIGREVESVKTLVDEFSQFARWPAAQPAPCDLNSVLDDALAVFHGRLGGIEIVKSLNPNLPPVMLDREQFKRVVVNLVDNAAEAMHDSPVKRLYVETHLSQSESGSPDSVELIVADTGCGITTEAKEKLFLPYFSTKNRGTGLGLAIVSHIVAEHNAQIRVEDNHPAGVRFIIEVPLQSAVESEARTAEAKA
jgi:nitrogen fixation/metabolism regulation signal transduction histidine kinase